MARYLVHFDGFHSREYLNAWPFGPGARAFPGSNAYSGNPAFQDAVPNEGRFFGQAWNGSYDVATGGQAFISPFDDFSGSPKDYWQWGYWIKYNAYSSIYFNSLCWPYHFPRNNNLRSTCYGGGVMDDGGTPKVAWTWGNSSTERVFGPAATSPIVAGKWVWIEERVYTHLSAGFYELRANGVQLGRINSVRTMESDNGGFNCLRWYQSAGTTNSYDLRWDDLYVMAGDSEGDFAWFNRSVCEPIAPTGDGDQSDGTPSTGTAHYAVVDDLPKNDADYLVLTAGNAKKELFTFSDIDTTRTRTIQGVKVVARAKKTDVGIRKMRAICKVGGTVYSGSTFYVHPGWVEIQHIWQQNPNTAAAWTAAEVNGAQFGFEQVT